MLGVRAENIRLSSKPGKGENALPIDISRIDDYGNYKLVVGQCSGADAKVKVDRDAPIDQGPLFMSFKPEQACVYVNEQLVT